MKPIIVAVDGPAGSGKSTVSRRVALVCGLRYIDSGALYRAVTLKVLERDGSVSPSFVFTPDLARLRLEQEFLSDGTCRTCLDGRDVTNQIREERIARSIGIISDNREVREFINALLRAWAGEGSIIMDGRDIGSVVFPHADLKIYLDASVEVRAMRRIGEYRDLGKNVDENLVKKQIIQRDREDMSRPYGALVRCEDARYIDTSHMDIRHVVDTIKGFIDELRMCSPHGVE